MARPRHIQLSGRHSEGKWTLVDAALYGWLSAMTWRLHSNGYAMHTFTDGERTHAIYLHRLIAFGTEDDPREIHHINGDRLDNRRRNLMVVTHAEHMALHACATEIFS